MLSSLGNDDQISSLDLLLFTTDNSLGYSTGKDQVLVDGMDLLSDISSNRDSHNYQLRTLSGPENIPELGILRWDRIDVLEMVHFLGWCWHLGRSRWGE